jgi:hypothetical protein
MVEEPSHLKQLSLNLVCKIGKERAILEFSFKWVKVMLPYNPREGLPVGEVGVGTVE